MNGFLGDVVKCKLPEEDRVLVNVELLDLELLLLLVEDTTDLAVDVEPNRVV